MPIYEFRCESCNDVFEYLALKASEEQGVKCPNCGGETLSRVMSASNSIMGDSSSSGSGASGPQVQNRTCKDSGSCTTITLPGHER